MNYDSSEVKKLREQHALLQAECARLREALENISFQENLYINEDEHRAFLICKKLADEALKLMPVQTESEPRDKVWVYGSDGCKNCETGRITLYAKSGWCVECQSKKSPTPHESGETDGT